VPEIFINYRTGDGERFAVIFDQDLSRRFGSDNVFRASKSIRPGRDFRKALSSASAAAHVLLVLIGPSWLDDDDKSGGNPLTSDDNWTRKEILNAIEYGAHIVPVLCGRQTPRLSRTILPSGLDQLADYQSLRYDTGNSDADLDTIAKHLMELLPGLIDATAADETRQADPGGVDNTNSGGVSGVVTQAKNIDQNHSSVGRTVINNPQGHIQTGDAPQYNAPVFHGGTNNYVAGKNTGGIHQHFGTHASREEQQ
jgi:hypothetical protein